MYNQPPVLSFAGTVVSPIWFCGDPSDGKAFLDGKGGDVTGAPRSSDSVGRVRGKGGKYRSWRLSLLAIL